MITIFTTPKAWNGHIGLIQKNALKNWKELGYEIILYCDDEGTAKAAKDFKVKHVPSVAKTKMGTPIIGQIFQHAQSISKNKYLMYANTDIIFVRGLKETVNFALNRFKNPLIVGSRYNLNVEEEIDYSKGWQDKLEKRARKYGVAHPGTGVDYFLFYNGMYPKMPDFALGRGCWDTWLIGKAVKDGNTVVDSTKSIFVVHQNHDYQHLPLIAPHRGRRSKWYSKGPETAINEKLRNGVSKSCRDAKYKLDIDSKGEITYY